MADINRTIFVQVVTLDPVSGGPIPVPDVRVQVQHRRVLWDQTLSQGEPVTDADGIAEVTLRFDDAELTTDAAGEESLSFNPYFRLTLPAGQRDISSDPLDPLRPSFTLPGEWESRHDGPNRLTNLTRFRDRNQPFQVYFGLSAQISLAYSDFQESRSNPIALPESAVELALIDADIFFDDTLTGIGYDPHRNRIIPLGKNEGSDRHEDRYPYFDPPPTVPYALDLSEDDLASPRAWIDPPGGPLGRIGGGSFAQVGGLAVDAHGFVFMVDSAGPSPVIHRFYPDGTLCETLATWLQGGTTTRFQNPQGMALDRHRRLLVADGSALLVFRLNNGAARLSASGELPADAGRYRFSHRWDQWTDASSGTLAGFGSPQGIAIVPSPDSDDQRLAVADAGRTAPPVRAPAIHLFDLTGSTRGNLLHRLSFAPGAGVAPVAVAAGQASPLFVVSRDQHQVSAWQIPTGGGGSATQTWQVGGTAGSSNTQFDAPVAAAWDAKHGILSVVDRNNRRVQRLNGADGSFLATWGSPYAEPAASPFAPVAIATDRRSETYLADGGNQLVVRASAFAADGVPLGPSTPPRTIATWTPYSEQPHLHQPTYVHWDAQGRLWVSDTGNNRVLAYGQGEDGLWQPVRVLSGLDAPIGVATTPTGEVFVVESGSGQVSQFGATGDSPTSTTPGLSRPQGLVYASRANLALYVADTGNDRVLRINRDGSTTTVAPPSSALAAPEDVALDGQGRLYALDRGNQRLARFLPDDSFDRFIALNDPALGLADPAGLSVAPDGRLLVSDRHRHRIVALTLQETERTTTARLSAYWDLLRFIPQSFYRRQRAARDGTVQFGGGLAATPREDFMGLSAWQVTAAGTLTVGGGPTMAWAQGDLLFVRDNASVSQNDDLGLTVDRTLYYPELARHLLLSEPSRAVLDDRGRLAIADTQQHRIRLVRIATRLDGNLFDLGLGLFEGNPDLFLRARSRSDRRQEPALALQVAAGRDTDSFGSADEWKHATRDEFAADTYVQTSQFSDQTSLKAMAVNAVRVMQEVQRWLVHNTRQDSPDQRWGSAGKPDFLGADVKTGRGSFHRWFSDVLSMGSDAGGRGHDAWDDSTIAHEMGHWLFNASLQRHHAEEVKTRYQVDEHFASLVFTQVVALVEGYGEYLQLFWGSEFTGRDRNRGFAASTLSSLRPAGGGAAVGLYSQRNQGLENEGYFANSLWQIHHLIADPGIGFADAPSYWWAYNSRLSDAQSQRLVDVLRVPLRQFPENDPSWPDTPNEHLFRQILAQVHRQHPDYGPPVQQIYEINNQLMPQLRLRRLEGGSPGAGVTPPLTLAAGGSQDLVADLRDAAGAPLVGYNLLFENTGGGGLTLTAPATTPLRGSRVADVTGYSQERPTDAQGEVRFTYQAPATATGTMAITVAYQPWFISAGPTADASRETMLQTLYMQTLHRVGPPQSRGFELTLTVEVNLS